MGNNCAGFHNVSHLVYDVETDEQHLQCKDCGQVFDDPDLVNEAIIKIIQHRFSDLFEPVDMPPSRDRPEAN